MEAEICGYGYHSYLNDSLKGHLSKNVSIFNTFCTRDVMVSLTEVTIGANESELHRRIELKPEWTCTNSLTVG